MTVELTKERAGWDISVKDDTGAVLRTAWADTGSSAYDKASRLADYYRDENGQTANIHWNHLLNSNGEWVKA